MKLVRNATGERVIDMVLPWPTDGGHLDHATPSFSGKDNLAVVLGQHRLANVLSL